MEEKIVRGAYGDRKRGKKEKGPKRCESNHARKLLLACVQDYEMKDAF